MDLWCVHAKSSGSFLGRNYFFEKPIYRDSKNSLMGLEVRIPRKKFLLNDKKYQSILVRAVGKQNPGNSHNVNFNSSSSGSGKGDQPKPGGDDMEGKKHPPEINKSGDNGFQRSQGKPLDWREFRTLLYIQEQAENVNSDYNQEKAPGTASLPPKWAHPLTAPENGCLLVATEKLDGVCTFERSVVLLLKCGTKNLQEGPFGVIINRPLNKKMRHMNPTNVELATTFADCSLHFGGPLYASMFLLGCWETTGHPCFEEVIPGVYFCSRNTLDEASRLVKKGELKPQDCRFFVGYAGWQLDQLIEEIESDYWYVAACSANMILGGSLNSSRGGLWEEILQLMGGHYSELIRKPKQDM